MRNIAILREGYTDFLVIKKFIKCILSKESLNDKNFIDLETINIINPISKYLDNVSKSKDYSLDSHDAKELINELIQVYYGCYSRFRNELDVVTNKEIIVINADAEKLLMKRSNYFESYMYTIKILIYYSVEKFYERMSNEGYEYEYIPFITPLIFFPSSEILVASCMYDITKDNLRELKPNPDLKVRVYGTSSMNDAVTNGTLENVLEENLTCANINKIYNEIPEARMLIHYLTV